MSDEFGQKYPEYTLYNVYYTPPWRGFVNFFNEKKDKCVISILSEHALKNTKTLHHTSETLNNTVKFVSKEKENTVKKKTL